MALSTAASRLGTLRSLPIIVTNSRPFMKPYTVSCSDITPMRLYSDGLSRTGWPNAVTVPVDTGAEQAGDAGHDVEGDVAHGHHAAEPARHVLYPDHGLVDVTHGDSFR